MKNDLDMKSDTENEEDGTMSTESADVRPAESTDARPAGAQQPTHHHSQPSHHHGHALAGILGPAFVAAVAYVDPGNVAANITSGARYGYLLVWVLAKSPYLVILGGVTVGVVVLVKKRKARKAAKKAAKQNPTEESK